MRRGRLRRWLVCFSLLPFLVDVVWGVANVGDGIGIWTELALAYAIHKSFIFIRVPLTAAVTPKVVKVMRGWGWDIGKKGGAKEAVKKARGRN